MNIIINIDQPLEHYLRTNNYFDKFNQMIEDVLDEVSFGHFFEDNDPEIIFFITKKEISPKFKKDRKLAKKKKLLTPLLSCQNLIKQYKGSFIHHVKYWIKKILIWPMTTKTSFGEANEIVVKYYKGLLSKSDPEFLIARRKLGNKKFKKLLRKLRLQES